MSSSSYLADEMLAPGHATRLFLSLIAGLPLGFVYRKYLYGRTATTQHLFFTCTGVALFVFNYGLSVVHSMISILVAYLLCQYAGGTMFSLVFGYTFYMIYLIAGYYCTASDTYDLSWALPQCVLTLRMIGLIFDVYDGYQEDTLLSPYQQMAAVRKKPNLLEIAAYTYFYGGCLVGPQFPLQRFRKLINGEYGEPGTTNPPKSAVPAAWRFLAGIAYLTAHLSFHSKWPTEFCLSQEFFAYAYWKKVIYIVIWFRFIVMRYQAVWLVAESVCIYHGLGHNVNPESGEQLWDGVRNIRLTKFELGSSFQCIVESFNYNTNQWAFNYCFKRLRFLGNKNLSHLLTLAFLALWHGTNSGYFVCFLFEYICIITERKAVQCVSNNEQLSTLVANRWLRIPLWFVQKFIILYSCGFGFLPFSLLAVDKWLKVYSTLYFNGWIAYALAYFTFAHFDVSQKRRRGQSAKPIASKSQADADNDVDQSKSKKD